MLTTEEVEQVAKAVGDKVDGVVTVAARFTDEQIKKLRADLPEMIVNKSKEITDEKVEALKKQLPSLMDQVLQNAKNGGSTRRPFMTWQDVEGSRKEKHKRLVVPSPALVQRIHRAHREGLPYVMDEALGGVDELQNIPGAPVAGAVAPWYRRTAGDPFQAFARQLDATAGTVKDLQLSNVAFRAEAQVDTSQTGANGPRQIQGGSAGADHVLLNYICLVFVSHTAEEDVTGTIATYDEVLRQAWNKLRGAEAVTKLKAAATKNVLAAVTKKWPDETAANGYILKVLAKMRAQVADYDMGPESDMSYVVHPDWYALVQAVGAEGWAFDQRLGVQTVQGYPIVSSTALDDSDAIATTDKPAMFGWWGGGLVQAQRGMLHIEQYRETTPGGTTIFAWGRYLPYVTNGDALCVWKAHTA